MSNSGASKKPLKICEVLELPYSSDPAGYFGLISAQEGAVLLDSGRPRSPLGRYDIMTAWPIEVLEPNIGEAGAAFFSRARAALAYISPARPPSPIEAPFTGGLLGYLSYDFGKRLLPIATSTSGTTSVSDARIGLYLWALITDHQCPRTFLLFHPDCSDYQRGRVTHIFGKPAERVVSQDFSLTQPFILDTPKDRYRVDIERIHDYILSGDCYQVNYAQRYQACYQGDPWSAYMLVRAACPTPFSAFFKLPHGAISSHSPERFISVGSGRVEARPIKGTRPRHPDVVEDARLARELEESIKDRAENVMIVDLLRNDLGKVCVPGSVRVTELFSIESYPNVHHLVSAIEGTLYPLADVWTLLEASFPGGSITGAPKIRAMQIIDELEPEDRNVYCGSIFYVDCRGRMDSSITIRTMLFDHGHAFCWGGGGIIYDSLWEAEYQEVANKVGALIDALEATIPTSSH